MKSIVINKIVRDHVKGADGKPIRDPETKKPIEEGYKIVEEAIDIEIVKSAREWHRSADFNDKYGKFIKGKITVLSLKSEINGKNSLEISEDFKSWIKRSGAIDVER